MENPVHVQTFTIINEKRASAGLPNHCSARELSPNARRVTLMTPVLVSSMRENIVATMEIVRIEGMYRTVLKNVPAIILRFIIYAISIPKKA
jgi:hypothetical protein